MFDKNGYMKEYRKNKLKRIPLDVTPEQYESIKSHTDATHESVNGFIKRAINETIERDNNSPNTHD